MQCDKYIEYQGPESMKEYQINTPNDYHFNIRFT
jgi:hypothetical protein